MSYSNVCNWLKYCAPISCEIEKKSECEGRNTKQHELRSKNTLNIQGLCSKGNLRRRDYR